MPERSEHRLTRHTFDAMSVEAGNAVFRERDLADSGVRVHATDHTAGELRLRDKNVERSLAGSVAWVKPAACRFMMRRDIRGIVLKN